MTVSPRTLAIGIVCALAACAISFAWGRRSVPKVVDRSSEVSSLSAQIAALKGTIAEKERLLAQKKTSTRTVKDRYAPPQTPGSPPVLIARTTTDTAIDEASSSDRQTFGVWSLDYLGQTQTTGKTSEHTESGAPDWRLGVGAEWNGVHEKPDAYRIEVDRRVIGPFWLGVRAGSDRTAGAVVSVEW